MSSVMVNCSACSNPIDPENSVRVDDGKYLCNECYGLLGQALGESEESTEETTNPMEALNNEDEFKARVAHVAELIQDPEKFRLCIAEIYVYINMMDQMARQIASGGGPMKMLKMVMGRG